MAVLDSRESVSNTRDRLTAYFQAKGVEVTEPSAAASQIFVGGALTGSFRIQNQQSQAPSSLDPGTYGSATESVSIVVNSKGVIVDVSEQDISIDSSQISDFSSAVDASVADAVSDLAIVSSDISDFGEAAQDAVGSILTDSSSIDFTYNDGTPSITAAVLPAAVDHNSLLNYSANKHIDHTAVSISAGTGLSGGGDISASRSISLANTSVSAASYGSATQVAGFTVDAQGRLTAAANTTIAIASSQIASGTIADARLPAPATSAISSTAIDWSLLKISGGLYTKTLAAGITFTFSNPTAGQAIVVRLTNTVSNYSVTWPSVKWADGAAPTMSPGAVSDIYTFVYDGTDYFGSAVQNMS